MVRSQTQQCFAVKERQLDGTTLELVLPKDLAYVLQQRAQGSSQCPLGFINLR